MARRDYWLSRVTRNASPLRLKCSHPMHRHAGTWGNRGEPEHSSSPGRMSSRGLGVSSRRRSTVERHDLGASERRWVGLVLLAASLGPLAAITSSLMTPQISKPHATVPTNTSPIQHVIVIMKENHAFGNYFGTFPGADGIPSNVSLPDGVGGTVSPHWINGASTPDLPPSRTEMLAAYKNGPKDLFAVVAEPLAQGTRNVSVGYYARRQHGNI